MPAAAAFHATVENTRSAPAPSPPGMVWIPGGEFSMGAAAPPGLHSVGMQATTDSRPVHRVYVDGFWMDQTEVTNAQFAKFIEATAYVTVAERALRAEDFPGAPPENLLAGGVVFSPPAHPVPLTDHFQWWSYVTGASSRHPQGPDGRRPAWRITRSCRSLTTMRWRMRRGRASACPPKRNGSSPRAAG